MDIKSFLSGLKCKIYFLAIFHLVVNLYTWNPQLAIGREGGGKRREKEEGKGGGGIESCNSISILNS